MLAFASHEVATWLKNQGDMIGDGDENIYNQIFMGRKDSPSFHKLSTTILQTRKPASYKVD